MLTDMLDQDPENVAVLKIMAYSYYIQGEMREALSIYDTILNLAPVNVDALYNRGIILWKLEKANEAEASFTDLLNLLVPEEEPTYLDTLYNLAELLQEQERYQDATVYWLRYLERVPDDVSAYLYLGQCYRGLERYDRALETYDSLLAFEESMAEPWASKAEILLTKVQDPVAGLDALNQALVLGFQDSERIQALLDDPELYARMDVEELVERWRLLPK